jgi:hypothetical protein
MQDKNFIVDLDGILNKTDNTPVITESVQTEEPVTESVTADWDEIIAEWFYRLPKGFAEQPYTESELKVLDQVIMEYKAGEFKPFITETAQINEIDQTTAGIKKSLIDKIIVNKKQKAFATFLRNLPGGQAEAEVPQFLNKLSTKEQDEFVKKLYSVKSVDDIKKSDYESGVGNKLFGLEPKGIGKAELFLAMMIANSKVSGGGESFDLMINNVKKYEVKDYRVSNSAGIRLGTKGKVTRFPFWNEIMKTLDVLDELIASDGLTFIQDKALQQLITDISDRGEFTRKGELSKDDIKKFKELYLKLNELAQSDSVGYTYITLRGPNVEPVSYTIDEIPAKLKKSVTINLRDRGASDSLIVNLRRLKYVRDPKQLDIDIQKTIDLIIGDLPFIVFRPAGPIITTEFAFSNITMATVYIIEKELANKAGTKKSKK